MDEETNGTLETGFRGPAAEEAHHSLQRIERGERRSAADATFLEQPRQVSPRLAEGIIGAKKLMWAT